MFRGYVNGRCIDWLIDGHNISPVSPLTMSAEVHARSSLTGSVAKEQVTHSTMIQ